MAWFVMWSPWPARGPLDLTDAFLACERAPLGLTGEGHLDLIVDWTDGGLLGQAGGPLTLPPYI